MGLPPSWPLLNLIISQSSHFLIHDARREDFSIWTLKIYKHSVLTIEEVTHPRLVSCRAGTGTQAAHSRFHAFNFCVMKSVTNSWAKHQWFPQFSTPDQNQELLGKAWKILACLGVLHIPYPAIQQAHPVSLCYTEVEGCLHTVLDIGTTESLSTTDLPQRLLCVCVWGGGVTNVCRMLKAWAKDLEKCEFF